MDNICNYFCINNVCFLAVLAFMLHVLFLSRKFVYKFGINFGKSCSALGLLKSGYTKLCNSDYQNRAWTSKLICKLNSSLNFKDEKMSLFERPLLDLPRFLLSKLIGSRHLLEQRKEGENRLCS